MSDTLAVVSDARGTADLDRTAIDDHLDVTTTLSTSRLAARLDEVRAHVFGDDRTYDRAVVVAPAGAARRALVADLREGGIQAVTVSPFLGNGQATALATSVVAGAADAALANLAASRQFAETTAGDDERVVVVGDAGLAADLATVASVTLLANGGDVASTALPGSVDVVAGRPTELLEASEGYDLLATRRVTDACTGCGRCFGEYPDRTTARPVDVVDDAELGDVCPVDAIRPPDDPERVRVSASQVVWPGYEGPLSEDPWVHTDAERAVAAVRHGAEMRRRPRVRVEEDRCAAGAGGREGCRECEAICPNDAITIDDATGAVAVDATECVACGSCVSVCPTGAVDPVRTPDLATLAGTVDRALQPLVETATSGSLLPFGDETDPVGVAFVSASATPALETALSSRTLPAVVPVVVPNVLHVSDAAVVHAIARGADGVVLVASPERPTDPVEETATAANAALEDLGLGDRVQVVDADAVDAVASGVRAAIQDPIDVDDSRDVETATRHDLARHATVALADAVDVSEPVRIPASGTVTAEEAACTLCDACVRQCPVDALDREAGHLDFDQSACVGCGRCASACPEDALDVDPAVEVSADGHDDSRTLVEADTVTCSACGAAFASAAGLEAVREQLDGPALEATPFETCPSCRKRGLDGKDGRVSR